jgi:polyisoprenoid-binding protein YceI
MTTTETTPDTSILPAPGVFVVDPTHSNIEFVARHLVGSKVRGRFTEFTGTITVADPVEQSTVEAEVQAASLHTAQEQRDAHVRSADFLDADQYPTLTLKSTGLTSRGQGRFTLDTDLTIHGVTRPVAFDLEYLGTGPGLAPGSEVIALEATADIDRRDFDVKFSAALPDAGGLVVGNKVRIELTIEAQRQAS